MAFLRRTTTYTQKPDVARLNRSHPLARDLIGAWIFNEGAGSLHNLVTGKLAFPSGAPTWIRGTSGPVGKVVGASSQYWDAGVFLEASAVSQLTVMCRMFRASSGDTIDVLPGTSNAVNWGLTWQGTGFLYFGVATGTQAYGNIANTQTGWHDFATVFDGTQTGNTNRLQGYVDGVAQTLSYLNTIPSTTPNLTTAQLQFGHSTSLSAYSTGYYDWVFIWRRPLSAREIADVRRNPYALLEPARAWRLAPDPAAVVGAFSLESPSVGATNEPYDGMVSAVFTPIDSVVNAVIAARLYLNGRQLDETVGSLGPSGAVEVSGEGPAYARSVNHVRLEVDTDDGATSVDEWSYTTFGSPLFPGLADFGVPGSSSTYGITDYVRPSAASAFATTDLAVLNTGFVTTTVALADYAVQPTASGYLNANVEMVDYYTSLFVEDRLVDIGAVVAERNVEPQAMGVNLFGTERETLANTGTSVAGTAHDDLTTAGASVAFPTEDQLVTAGAVVASHESDPIAVGAVAEPVSGRLVVEVDAASTRQMEVEEEP